MREVCAAQSIRKVNGFGPAINSIVWCSAAQAISKPPCSANCTSSRICRMTWRGSLSGAVRSMLTAMENFMRRSAPQETTHQPRHQLWCLDQDAVAQVGENLQFRSRDLRVHEKRHARV